MRAVKHRGFIGRRQVVPPRKSINPADVFTKYMPRISFEIYGKAMSEGAAGLRLKAAI